MNSASDNSATTTASTSMNEPKSNQSPSPTPDKSALPISEADYLQQQADAAKRAIAHALADAKAALGEGLDPKEWARRFPFVAIGSAVAAGFVAAVLTIPSREQQELKKLEKIRRALHPEPEPHPSDKDGNGKAPEEKSTLWSTLLREAVHMIRPVLLSAITASITGRHGSTEQPVAPSDETKVG